MYVYIYVNFLLSESLCSAGVLHSVVVRCRYVYICIV